MKNIYPRNNNSYHIKRYIINRIKFLNKSNKINETLELNLCTYFRKKQYEMNEFKMEKLFYNFMFIAFGM